MKNKLTIPFLFICVFIVSCKIHIGNKAYKVKNMHGKVVKETFVSKGGVEMKDMYDLFFVTDSTRYYIKTAECKVSEKELIKFVNHPVVVTGKIYNGNWDSDEPNVQSRVGYYIAIHEIADE